MSMLEPVKVLPTRRRSLGDAEQVEPSLIGKSMTFVLKVVSRCNLNCTYCYVYNKGDATWKDRPVVMREDVLERALDRTEESARHDTLRENAW